MSEQMNLDQVSAAIHPYEAADVVAKTLVEKGFAKEKPFKCYEPTSYGKENPDYFENEERDYEKELFEHKVKIIQSWINTAISVAAFVLSIIAICR